MAYRKKQYFPESSSENAPEDYLAPRSRSKSGRYIFGEERSTDFDLKKRRKTGYNVNLKNKPGSFGRRYRKAQKTKVSKQNSLGSQTGISYTEKKEISYGNCQKLWHV